MQFTQFCRNSILRLKFETSPLSADNVNWVTRWYWFIHTNYMVELVHTEDRNWVYKNQKIIKTQADWFEFPDYLYWIANSKLQIVDSLFVNQKTGKSNMCIKLALFELFSGTQAFCANSIRHCILSDDCLGIDKASRCLPVQAYTPRFTIRDSCNELSGKKENLTST